MEIDKTGNKIKWVRGKDVKEVKNARTMLTGHIRVVKIYWLRIRKTQRTKR